MEDSSISGDVKRSGLLYYTIISTRLGMINCDRFYYDSAQKTDFIVEVDNSITNPSVVLLFEEINSVMYGESYEQTQEGSTKMVFPNVPVGKKVKIISVGNQGDIAVTSTRSAEVSSTPFKTEGFSSFTLKEFKSQFER